MPTDVANEKSSLSANPIAILQCSLPPDSERGNELHKNNQGLGGETAAMSSEEAFKKLDRKGSGKIWGTQFTGYVGRL